MSVATAKKKENKAKNVVLVAGTQQTLSNLYFLSISMTSTHVSHDWLRPRRDAA
jgi:hypothetical protein